MEEFFQGLQTNSSVLAAFVILYVMIIKQGHKMELGFKDIRSEVQAVIAELKQTNKHLKRHDRHIKKLKKEHKESLKSS